MSASGRAIPTAVNQKLSSSHIGVQLDIEWASQVRTGHGSLRTYNFYAK